jgi:hypothetical protein
LRGRGFSTGLGVHSASSMSYALNGRYSSFRATVGVDDETVGRGSVVFQVHVDGTLRWTSPVVTGTSPAVPVVLSVSGAQSLRLTVADGDDGTAYDHADWADAFLTS